MSYREYFNIDPEYFPQVDKKLIEEKPDLWKKFWPHPTFVQLLKAMVDVLERKQKLSMWVDGAYGTGKSHAVFTLKKLIEASDEETTAYFEKYGLDNFLCKKLLNQKNEGKILVCHRYGSSDIQSDTDLIVAMQEGIEKALTEAGIENTANTSLKNSLIRFFENEENRQSFDIYAKGTYKTALGGDTSDSVLKKLSSYLLEPDKYTSKVQKAVTAYKNAQKYTQLKKHWLDLTGTDSPYAWSNKYGMPILAMVPDAEMSIARKVFGFINSKTKDEESIATAEDYLSKITYADKLSSKSERDKAFRDVFLGDYTILFDDVDEVIDYLKSHVTESPYHWMGSKEVSVKIKGMANANYVKSGYSEAKQVIDNMPVDQLKDYLKKLIEDNIAVGVEIIKGQK